MKILLTGASGQLGTELLSVLGEAGRVVALDRNRVPAGDHDTIDLDLGDARQLAATLDRIQPGLIVNAAAYTAVDRAERDPDTAMLINARVPAQLAAWAREHGSKLLHYSTDYVFDGSAKRPYREDDSPAPLNLYGHSKLEGEREITASGCDHVILRTSWIYSAHGHNFMLRMLQLAAERPGLSVVDDQVGCPTWARNLARISLQVYRQWAERQAPGGLYHYCDADAVSWFGFARSIVSAGARLGLLEREPEMLPVNSEAYPQEARRPAYSVLDTGRIQSTLGVQPAGLERSLENCLEEAPRHD